MAAPDYSSVTGDIQKGYGAQRQQAAAQESANLQGQKDALARRQAALGNAPGGAFVQAEQTAGNDSAQRLQGANANIDQAQNAELRGVHMTQLGQQFQSSEREAGQQFAQGQQGREIDAQKAMQLTGINAQSSLQDRQIAAQKLMQKTGIDAQKAMQMVGLQHETYLHNDSQQFQSSMAQHAQDIQQSQFADQLGFERDKFNEQTGVDKFNEDMAQKMFSKKDMLESFFGNFSMGNIGGGLSSFFGGLSGSKGGGSGGGGSSPGGGAPNGGQNGGYDNGTVAQP